MADMTQSDEKLEKLKKNKVEIEEQIRDICKDKDEATLQHFMVHIDEWIKYSKEMQDILKPLLEESIEAIKAMRHEGKEQVKNRIKEVRFLQSQIDGLMKKMETAVNAVVHECTLPVR